MLSSKHVILILIIMLASGCGYNSVFDQVQIINNGNWAYTDTVKFEVTIEDTISYNDIYLVLRNNNGYHYNNFIAFIQTSFPNNQTRLDTVQIQLASKSGKWLGSGVGDVFTSKQAFVLNTRFPVPGKYTIEIIHAMRDELLIGVNDVGLSIRKRAD